MKQKTITLGQDEPISTLCMGHVDFKTFNKAFKAEGWVDGLDSPEELSYEYWRPYKDGAWKPSTPTDKKAVPVTVVEW